MRLQNPIHKQGRQSLNVGDMNIRGQIVGGGLTGGGAEIILRLGDGTERIIELDGAAYDNLAAEVGEGKSIIGEFVTVHGEESGIWFEFH